LTRSIKLWEKQHARQENLELLCSVIKQGMGRNADLGSGKEDKARLEKQALKRLNSRHFNERERRDSNPRPPA
jgi:hypothetical protein